jgi:cyclic beta-1,2-glucan synthetase
MAVMARVDLAARGHATLAFVTAVGRSRNAALELARRHGSLHVVRWAVRDAEPEAARRVRRSELDPGLLPVAQRVLSALLHPDRRTRAPAEVLATARPCKSRLWGHGISGDDPILLVRTGPGGDERVVRDVLSVQRYLRACAVHFDVVLLDESASGYLDEGTGALRRLISQMGIEDWIHRRGGIHVIASDQLDDDGRQRLDGAARLWLDARKGSLEDQLTPRASRPPLLPRFEPSLVAREEEARGALAPCPELLFDNGIGGFTRDGREYVVRLEGGRGTPMPWCNVLANAVFGCIVSESALGSTWSLNAGENRLTPWRNDPLGDAPSEALYLRDEETAAVWSPTPLPAGEGSDTRVRHGAGYTIYETESHGLFHELTVFVPPDAPVKIARLRLENRTSRHRRLTATYYAEWVLGTRREEGAPYVHCEHDAALGCLLAQTSWEAEFEDRVAFLASEKKPHGFTCDRAEFLGRGDLASPDALGRWGLSGSTEPALDPCAALQVHLELEPGESLETHFVLGEAGSREEAARCVARFRDAEAVRGARAALDAHWDRILGAVQVSTPEPAMDLMLNRWLLYQTVSSRIFGRTGFYQSSGAFGYRDQLQDVMAVVDAAPEIARAHVLEAASHQFEQGDVLHWWHPPSGRGVRTRCSDDMLWLPYVACHYALATGDLAIFSERVGYLTGEALRREEHDRYAHFQRGVDGTLLEHCRRALERGFTSGPHGLPLMKDGDWNDGMNRVGPKERGESVWLGWFVYATANRFADACDRLGERSEAAAWRQRAEELRARLAESAWDGDWYLRAFHDDGSLLGSAAARVCRIDSIAQSWSVLSGAADATRGRRAVHMADDVLVREADRLVLLLWPPFDGTKHDPGYIAAYPPGVRENGGQYTHAATWLGWAHAKLGDGDAAERIMRLLNPVLHASTSESAKHYQVEPYVLAGDVYGIAPYVGRGGWTWYTGAAAWGWRLGVEAILGLRREPELLRVDPCVPRHWPGFEAWLRVGSETLHVVVDNPERVSSGVSSMIVDGALVESNGVRLSPGETRAREVRVRLGAPRTSVLERTG